MVPVKQREFWLLEGFPGYLLDYFFLMTINFTSDIDVLFFVSSTLNIFLNCS